MRRFSSLITGYFLIHLLYISSNINANLTFEMNCSMSQLKFSDKREDKYLSFCCFFVTVQKK